MSLEERLTSLASDLYAMYGGKMKVDMGALLNAADAMSSAAKELKGTLAGSALDYPWEVEPI